LDVFEDLGFVKNNFNGFSVKTETEFIEKTQNILTNSTLRNKLSSGALKTSKSFQVNTFEKCLENIF
jgi:hypothetical protein